LVELLQRQEEAAEKEVRVSDQPEPDDGEGKHGPELHVTEFREVRTIR
jgi:hypothetical protein